MSNSFFDQDFENIEIFKRDDEISHYQAPSDNRKNSKVMRPQ